MNPADVATRSSPVCSLSSNSSGDLVRNTSSVFRPLSAVSAASPIASAPKISLESLIR